MSKYIIEHWRHSWRLLSVQASAVGTVGFAALAAMADNWTTVAPWLGVLMTAKHMASAGAAVSFVVFIVRHIPQPKAMPNQPEPPHMPPTGPAVQARIEQLDAAKEAKP